MSFVKATTLHQAFFIQANKTPNNICLIDSYVLFYSNRKNADKPYQFYDMHRAKLLKFVAYFNESAAHLIAEAGKSENRIQIPQHSALIINDTHRDYMAKLKAKNASCSISDREFKILILYASSCTANQIAEMFHRSLNTIITHIICVDIYCSLK